VEVAFADTAAAVRDSKNASGPHLALTVPAFRRFVADVSGWRTSTFSQGGGSDCVEVAFAETAAAVRDSKNASGPHLALTVTAFRQFTAGVSRTVGGRS
jgi:hypothetical protein